MKKILPLDVLNLSFEQRKFLIHGFALSFLILAPPLMLPVEALKFRTGLFFFTMFCISCAYLSNCLYLVPQFLHKKKLLTFLSLIILSVILVFISRIVLSEFVLPDELMPPPIGFKPSFPTQEFRGVRLAAFRERGDAIHILPAIFPMIFAYALSTSVEVTAHWFKQSHKEKDIENERLHTELLFLKSQINPHFLFNTLNNIYSLAVDKSDDTETAILMLSQMMRYMLYETNALKVDLNSEIDYLKNYLSLQKLRLSRQKNIKLSIEIKGNPERMNIAPLLLIPLVENAFKHGLSYQQSSRIEVSLECRENLLFFRVQNSKPVENTDLRLYENSGIGLKNIKRRLDLLYPNAYKLFIEDNSEQYLVELNLELT